MGYDSFDRAGKSLILIPPHTTSYFYGKPDEVFAVARNYFDLRGPVGNTPYVGTIFIDVDLKRMERIFRSVAFHGNELFYVVNEAGDCFYSNQEERIGTNLTRELKSLEEAEDRFMVRTGSNGYGLSVVVSMDSRTAFGAIRTMQKMMYLCGVRCGAPSGLCVFFQEAYQAHA